MFFSKKEEKTGWEIKEQFLLNYKIDGSIESYKLSSLYACFNKVEARVCFWHENKFLVNCRCSESIFNKIVSDYKVFECDDYIPNVAMSEYFSADGDVWLVQNGTLIGKNQSFNLVSISVQEHQNGYVGVNFGEDNEIFRLEHKFKHEFMIAKETSIKQINSSLSGKALENFLENKIEKELLEERAKIAQRNEEIRANGYAHIILTTETVSPFPVEDRLGIITAECAYGMNIFKDVFAAFSDFFGGRSNATQNLLKDARDNVLFELRKEAFERGADAVVAVDLDYSEFSGGGKSMLFIVASGTAIKIKK